MARRRIRQLKVGDDTFLWSTRVKQMRDRDGRRAVVTVRKTGSRGHLRIVFGDHDGHDPPQASRMDSWVFYESRADADSGNPLFLVQELAVPSVIRALLDEARLQGWEPDDPRTDERDGWPLIQPLLQNLRRNDAS